MEQPRKTANGGLVGQILMFAPPPLMCAPEPPTTSPTAIAVAPEARHPRPLQQCGRVVRELLGAPICIPHMHPPPRFTRAQGLKIMEELPHRAGDGRRPTSQLTEKSF